MSVQGNKVVTMARCWIGTPYVHQASCKGAGCDCLGLVRGIWREILGGEPEPVPAYSPDWSEPQGDERLWQAALRHLVAKPLDQASAGDVILFRMRTGSVAKHLGVQSNGVRSTANAGVAKLGPSNEKRTFIHAYSNYGVIESPLSHAWQRRIVARFQFPEETD